MSISEQKAWDVALQRIPSHWHREFRDLMTTGEGSAEFLTFLEQHPACMDALDDLMDQMDFASRLIAAMTSQEPEPTHIVTATN